MAVIDSYPEGYKSSQILTYPIIGQTVVPGGTYVVSSAVFYLSRYSTSVGNIQAEIYATTGTHGTDAIPSGSALATSGVVDITTISTFPTFDLVTFNFTGVDAISLSNGTCYALAVNYLGFDGSNKLYTARDNVTLGHGGNEFYDSSGWNYSASFDVIFYLYGDIVKSVSVYDSISIGEFKLVDSDPPMAADLIFVADVPTVTVSSPSPSVYDSPSVSESVDLEYFYYISVNSPVSISEDITIAFESAINVNDSVALTESDSCIATCLAHTRVIPPVKAPVAELDAEGGNRANLDEKAPVAEASGQCGSQLVENAPVAELDSTCTFSTPATLEGYSPTASIESLGGSEEDGTSPVAEIEAESYSNYTEMDKNAPTARGEATSYEEQTASLSKKAPFPSIEAEGFNTRSYMEATAPIGYGSSIEGFLVVYGDLDAKAPVASILYNNGLSFANGAELDEKAPYASMLVDTGAGDTEQAISSYADRFEDYTVEYSR